MTDPEFPVGPAPDLSELVRRFGGYDKITSQAWAEFDAAMKAWQEARRTHYRTINIKGNDRPARAG